MWEQFGWRWLVLLLFSFNKLCFKKIPKESYLSTPCVLQPSTYLLCVVIYRLTFFEKERAPVNIKVVCSIGMNRSDPKILPPDWMTRSFLNFRFELDTILAINSFSDDFLIILSFSFLVKSSRPKSSLVRKSPGVLLRIVRLNYMMPISHRAQFILHKCLDFVWPDTTSDWNGLIGSAHYSDERRIRAHIRLIRGNIERTIIWLEIVANAWRSDHKWLWFWALGYEPT